MASNVRQSRTLEAYCCLRGLENEVTSDFCLVKEVNFHSLSFLPIYIILQMPLAVSKTLGARITGGIIHSQ